MFLGEFVFADRGDGLKMKYDSQQGVQSPLLLKISRAASKQSSLDVLGLHGQALEYSLALLL